MLMEGNEGDTCNVFSLRTSAFFAREISFFFFCGVGGTATQWRPQTEYFSRIGAVHIYEMTPACSSSSVLAHCDAAIDIEGIVVPHISQHFSRHKTKYNFFVGHSYGCALALWVLRRHVEEVRCLVLLSPSIVAPFGAFLLRLAATLPAFLWDALRCVDAWGGANSFLVHRCVGGAARKTAAAEVAAWNAAFCSRCLRSVLAALRWMQPAELRALLKRVSCVAIAGSSDALAAKSVRFLCDAASPNVDVWALSAVGHHPTVESASLVNALIFGATAQPLIPFVRDASPSVAAASVALRKASKWRQTPCIGSPLFHFVPAKSFRDNGDHWNWRTFAAAYPAIRHVISLHEGASVCRIAHPLLQQHVFECASKAVPSDADLQRFFSVVEAIVARDPLTSIAVHCNYGYNRTGYFICAFLVARLHMDIEAALSAFSQVRPPGIKHQHFIDSLFLRFSDYQKLN